jgi:hypothetical protein
MCCSPPCSKPPTTQRLSSWRRPRRSSGRDEGRPQDATACQQQQQQQQAAAQGAAGGGAPLWRGPPYKPMTAVHDSRHMCSHVLGVHHTMSKFFLIRVMYNMYTQALPNSCELVCCSLCTASNLGSAQLI